jgi:hypothetical protein
MRKTTALLALCALAPLAGRADDPDPEPPSIKVSRVKEATVTVASSTAGPVVKITTDAAMAKGTVRIDGKTVDRYSSFVLTFDEKKPPARLTFQLKSHKQLEAFIIHNGPSAWRLFAIGAKGKQVLHGTVDGGVGTKRNIFITFTVTPGKDHLQIEAQPAKGEALPKAPWTVSWRGPLKK